MAFILKSPLFFSGIGNWVVEAQDLIRGGAAVKRAASLLLAASLPGDGAGERGEVLEVILEGGEMPRVDTMQRGQEDSW